MRSWGVSDLKRGMKNLFGEISMVTGWLLVWTSKGNGCRSEVRRNRGPRGDTIGPKEERETGECKTREGIHEEGGEYLLKSVPKKRERKRYE